MAFRSYYHLLITSDESNPLDDASNEPALPELYHPEYPFQNCWSDFRSQYGWASWDKTASLVRSLLSDGRLQQSLFLATFERNRRNFKSISELISETAAPIDDEDTFDLEEKVRSEPRPSSRSTGTAHGSGRGATMINAPKINPNTFVHFSWLNESCAIRDYSKSPTIMPYENRNFRTSDVRHSVAKQVVIRNRRPISDTRYWYETTMNLNKSELSSKSADFRRNSEGLKEANMYTLQFNTDFDKQRLQALLANFELSIKREIDRSLSRRLRRELLESNPPLPTRQTVLQLARWCKTDRPFTGTEWMWLARSANCCSGVLWIEKS
jgi:hypothetical protein